MSAARTVALVRAMPATFAARAIRSNPSIIISQTVAEQQHQHYCDILGRILGKENVISVPQRDDQPDSLFVEDTVVVLRPSRHAIGLTPGAVPRRAEAQDVWHALERTCGVKVHNGKKPGEELLDGGDVLFTGTSYIVGLSSRTNVAGAKRFAQLVGELQPRHFVDYIKVPHGLHLKSICSLCGPNTIVASRKVDAVFLEQLKAKVKGSIEIFQVPDEEAANCLYLPKVGDDNEKDALVIRKEFPGSGDILRRKANDLKISQVHECDMSEIAKADGALTCCSVIVDL